MIVIGVAGAIGAGKDTVASYLQRVHGFSRMGWADALKIEVETIFSRTLAALLAETARHNRNGEIQWLSGLLEGEGSFGFNKSNGAPVISLHMSDRDVVARAARIMGGKVTGPHSPGPSHLGKKPMFKLQIRSNAMAAGWMMTIFQFMGDRRRGQISKALETRRASKARPGAYWRGQRKPILPDEPVTAPERDAIHRAVWYEKPPVVREFLQEFGTELRRHEDKDYWVKALVDRVFLVAADDPEIRIVIPDTRFHNEIDGVRGAMGGYLIEVARASHPRQGEHESEVALARYDGWDYVFRNDGTIQDLERQVEQWFKQTLPVIQEGARDVLPETP